MSTEAYKRYTGGTITYFHKVYTEGVLKGSHVDAQKVSTKKVHNTHTKGRTKERTLRPTKGTQQKRPKMARQRQH